MSESHSIDAENIIIQIGVEINAAILKVTKEERVNPSAKLNFFEIKTAMEKLKLKFTSEEIARLLQKYDQARDGTITSSQFIDIFTPIHQSSYLYKSFQAFRQISKFEALPTTEELPTIQIPLENQLLTPGGLHQALTSLGVEVTQIEAFGMSYRTVVRHRWHQTLSGDLELHLGWVRFIPKPSAVTTSTTSTSSNKTTTIPFVFKPDNTTGDELFNLIAMSTLVIWAGAFITARARQSTVLGRVNDFISLLAAVVFMCLLLCYVNYFLVVVVSLGIVTSAGIIVPTTQEPDLPFVVMILDRFTSNVGSVEGNVIFVDPREEVSVSVSSHALRQIILRISRDEEEEEETYYLENGNRVKLRT
ncbi:unnamed protein product [Microthlaspi erraticum]|uniref:EF-hand domain-containing protein n=1 Tax=Microthlaspi erraticum TaxID=1685480 RepID=A0A6D2K0V0_9BRAS|nr:unnamed protein product [Microthlaspi erraticum]